MMDKLSAEDMGLPRDQGESFLINITVYNKESDEKMEFRELTDPSKVSLKDDILSIWRIDSAAFWFMMVKRSKMFSVCIIYGWLEISTAPKRGMAGKLKENIFCFLSSSEILELIFSPLLSVLRNDNGRSLINALYLLTLSVERGHSLMAVLKVSHHLIRSSAEATRIGPGCK